MPLKLDNIGYRYNFTKNFILNDISLVLGKSRTIAIFGESGSGKSTLGKIVAGIIPQTKGDISFNGAKIKFPFKGEIRKKIQIIFQHPEISFNPKLRLLDSLKEPYKILKIPFSLDNLSQYLRRYGIRKDLLERRPYALSGGELQRLALARVMLMKPSLVVLDEPTSMLDVISQAQIISLLKKCQEEMAITYLFISHDMPLCEAFCDEIRFLKGGELSFNP
jgi:ABC-type dipeptide/oligopeptide/nickel transport system ATPase subunit